MKYKFKVTQTKKAACTVNLNEQQVKNLITNDNVLIDTWLTNNGSTSFEDYVSSTKYEITSIESLFEIEDLRGYSLVNIDIAFLRFNIRNNNEGLKSDFIYGNKTSHEAIISYICHKYKCHTYDILSLTIER